MADGDDPTQWYETLRKSAQHLYESGGGHLLALVFTFLRDDRIKIVACAQNSDHQALVEWVAREELQAPVGATYEYVIFEKKCLFGVVAKSSQFPVDDETKSEIQQ